MQAHGYRWNIKYWRDTAGRELDFVVARSRDEVDAIECKWEPVKFEPVALKTFRSYYSHGTNFLLSPIADPGYWKNVSGLEIFVCNPDGWLQNVENSTTLP